MKVLSICLIFLSLLFSQEHPSTHQTQLEKYKNQDIPPVEKATVLTGLDVLLNEQIHLIKGKSIGLVTNHTGLNKSGIPNYQLFLELEDVHLKTIFAPEHGFLGNVSAGEKIADQQTDNFPTIYSLYGNTRKPTPEMLAGLDVIIYDMQDVGARFYSYISTMGLVMEAAAEAGIPVMILDRPNPITGKIDGPILDMKFQSFVGMYPIPIRYGLTCGELAQMIAGEKWISTVPELIVIKLHGWKRELYFYETDLLFTPPSPNIPDVETAVLYPGMCLIEGTNISEGRGTDHPFQWIGAPWIDGVALAQSMNNKHLPGIVFEPISFTPVTIAGKALKPKYEDELCHGVNCKLLNAREFNSVETGVLLITTIAELYPEEFETKSSQPRLWGNEHMMDFNKAKEFSTMSDSFKLLSQKYYLY